MTNECGEIQVELNKYDIMLIEGKAKEEKLNLINKKWRKIINANCHGKWIWMLRLAKSFMISLNKKENIGNERIFFLWQIACAGFCLVHTEKEVIFLDNIPQKLITSRDVNKRNKVKVLALIQYVEGGNIINTFE